MIIVAPEIVAPLPQEARCVTCPFQTLRMTKAGLVTSAPRKVLLSLPIRLKELVTYFGRRNTDGSRSLVFAAAGAFGVCCGHLGNSQHIIPWRFCVCDGL